MPPLKVTVGDKTIRVRPGREITFGRDSDCDICLDPDDIGISRNAGRIEHRDEWWWVTNLSRKHPLHIVDENGMVSPLPHEADGWPPPTQPVVGTLNVLVAGEQHTHRLILKPMGRAHRRPNAPVSKNPVSTKSVPVLSNPRQRAVLVFLAAGYLRTMPDYDPRPRSRDDVAEAVDGSEQEVKRVLFDLAEALRREGVADLEDDIDSKLCEWHIAAGRLHQGDVEFLSEYTAAVTGQSPNTITQSRINIEIGHMSRKAARAIAALLEPRLRRLYGEGWLAVINKKYKPISTSTLDDDRFCLKIYAMDPAAEALGTNTSRQQAIELRHLANQSAHNRQTTFGDAHRARDLHKAISMALPS